MALNFPASPTEGQVYSAEGQSWKYTLGVWVITAGTDAEFLPLTGGTLTGPLVCGDSLNVVQGFVAQNAATFQSTVLLAQDPTQPLQAATKQYVDTVLAALTQTITDLKIEVAELKAAP